MVEVTVDSDTVSDRTKAGRSGGHRKTSRDGIEQTTDSVGLRRVYRVDPAS